MKVNTAYIGLGSNLGDRKDSIDKAVKMLAENEQIESVRVSELIETAPLGGANQPPSGGMIKLPIRQPPYLNAVAEVRTTSTPQALHQTLIEIENRLGRERKDKWAPRTIDLDLLLFENQVIDTPKLIVPHPQMHLRSFVLSGLCQLKPKLIHPVMKVTVNELAARLNGGDFALDPDRSQLISIDGNIGVGKTTLAKELAGWFGCPVLFEPYDENPFMPDVYAGKKELALDSQLFFLTSRIEQLNPNNLSAGQICISDYVFEKEQIYAGALLDSHQLAIYQEIYRSLAAKVTPPVLVIYLQDTPQNCLERIHRRNRPYEQQIQLSFLQQLDCDYDRLFYDWKLSPLLRVPASKLDYANRASFENLVGQIKYYIADKQNLACCSATGRNEHGSCKNN